MKTTCPDQETIVRALRSELSGADLESLAEHVEHCGSCAIRLEQCSAEDTTRIDVSRVAGHARSSTYDLPEELADRLKRMSSDLGSCLAIPIPANTELNNFAEILSPAESPEELGRLGGYRVLRLLGQGGMGLVFEAEDVRLGRRIALKVLHARFAAWAVARDRFLREARAVAGLDHDHIVPLFEVGEAGSIPYLVMPLLSGESLAARVAKCGALPLAQVVQIGRQVADALAHAHAKKIIHRDLKPANIWLETRPQDVAGERVRVLDFGLARSADGSDPPALSEHGLLLGTPAYMAPEQVRGSTCDERVDLYGLGVILYELATGVRPFAGADPLAILASVAVDRPKPPSELRPEISTALSDLILKLLSKDAADRPGSACEVRDALEKLLLASDSLQATPSVSVRSRFVNKAAIGLILAGVIGLFLWFAGGTTIRFATNRGQLVVEINDPNVAVRVRHNDVVVRDWSTQREFTLQVGEGVVEVSDDKGQILSSHSFDLKRGRTSIVSVRFEPPSINPADPIRELAEWIVAQQGRFSMRGSESKFVTAPEEIPEKLSDMYWIALDEPDRNGIEGFLRLAARLPAAPEILHLGGNALTDADMDQLASHPNLRRLGRLELHGANLTPKCLVPLRQMQLKFLDVEVVKVTDEWIPDLARIESLAGVGIAESHVTDRGLSSLRDLSLKVLSLYDCHEVTGKGLDNLGPMPVLEDLNVHGIALNAADLDRLRRFPALTTLCLGGCEIPTAVLTGLPAFSKLRVLRLTIAGITDDELTLLGKCTQLEHLELFGNPISHRALIDLRATLPNCKINADQPAENMP